MSKVEDVVLFLFCVALLISVLYIGFFVSSPASMKEPADLKTCYLQEGKPIVIIKLTGKDASSTCQKIIAMSDNRYFAYYNQPSTQYQVMCTALIRQVKYTIYDIVPMGTQISKRYSAQTICPLLQTHHRLVGEGF